MSGIWDDHPDVILAKQRQAISDRYREMRDRRLAAMSGIIKSRPYGQTVTIGDITEAVYTDGMVRPLPVPMPERADHGILGCPICAECGQPYYPRYFGWSAREHEPDYFACHRTMFCAPCQRHAEQLAELRAARLAAKAVLA